MSQRQFNLCLADNGQQQPILVNINFDMVLCFTNPTQDDSDAISELNIGDKYSFENDSDCIITRTR